jgi:DNA-binding transcriptional ArsR family regulator
MIRLRMSTADLERMRFAYSPLTEAAESLYMLHSGRIHPLHRGWYEMTGQVLRRTDTALLRAVIPARGCIANFLLGGTTDAATSIEQQLKLITDCPPEQLNADLEGVWRGDQMPPAARQLIAEGPSGGRRLADALWQYWQAGIEPYWRQIRALLDADVAHRAGRLARGGIEALMSDLHPELEMVDHTIQIVRRPSCQHDLTGAGLLLVPCVFAWPHLIAGLGTTGTPSLTYGPRGIGTLWETGGLPPPDDDDPLGALLGRTRAVILTRVALPRSTTDLALELSQSPSAVSAHLSILRRCGLVTSWRSGRRVLYQRTPLASSIVIASTPAAGIASDTTA